MCDTIEGATRGPAVSHDVNLGVPLSWIARIIELSEPHPIGIGCHSSCNVGSTGGVQEIRTRSKLASIRKGIRLRPARERMIDPESSPGTAGHVAGGW